MAFHAINGWYFNRGDDGSVTIRCPTAEVTLEAGTWASAVASVSARGETSETFHAALRFHDGGPSDD